MVYKYGLLIIPIIIVFFYLNSTADGQPEISQCQSKSSLTDTMFPENEYYNSVLLTTANSIGELPTLDSSTIQTFEQYKDFVDTTNDGVMILNQELGHTIPLLESTQVEYDKISKIIIKYTPMVNSYNNMVYSARNVDISDQNSITCFYTQSAIFSLELTLISTAVYAGPSYKIVGDVYRSSGLQAMAFKCPSCVSTTLSNAHWFVRTTFVEGTSATVIITLEGMNKFIPKNMLTP